MGNLASNNSTNSYVPNTTIMSRAFKQLLVATFGFGFSLLLLVCAQDQSGFISIDCGGTNPSSYSEEVTGLTFISDKDLIETGESNMIASEYRGTLQQQYNSLRSFPNGTRNCYTLNLTRSSVYLIRATFYYGNYDGLNKLPEFELHLGPNLWQTVTFKDLSSSKNHELIHMPLRDYIHVCLVNIGSGIPFISTIETRILPNSTFENQFIDQQSLALVERYDTGQVSPLKAYRYPYDAFDRIWDGYAGWANWTELTASSNVDTYSYDIPSIVLNTAATPRDETDSFVNIWLPDESNDVKSTYYIFLHFAEVVKLQPNQYRWFYVTTFGRYVESFAFSPKYGANSYFYNTAAFTRDELNISLIKMGNSTLPPILNAFEAYMVTELKGSETNKKDLDAISNIKRTYGVKKNWQGDPCAPQKYSWEGLSCTYPENNDSSSIMSLDLSSSGLKEDITQWISDIAMLQTLNLSNNNLRGSLPGFLSQLQNLIVLDLSNNNLTGSIPDTWSQLPNLNILYLDGNMLTGSVPQGLMLKQNNGFLSLRVCNNPNLSGAFPCKEKKKNNKPNIFLIAGLPIIGVLLIICLTVTVIFLRKRRSKVGRMVAVLGAHPPRKGSVELEPTRRKFRYSDILKITKNRQHKIGEGGFGTVYHGYINEETQVAVKMLSSSSTRGLEQFHAEVNSLMRVHHTNLASLIGYCDDEDHKGLVYEYMPMGNLQQILSDKSSDVLTWQDRLQIAVDAAQGLEYLHYGCKPPIIHRDIKTTNILISENFRAKISDFGLSRNFPVDNETHITTCVAGTPGYLAPEYKELNRFNEKSDVYSFGIVLLEIITGRNVVSRTSERTSIDEWVRSIFLTGDINKIVDPRLNEVFDVNSSWILLEIAMACISQEASKRPTMTKVVRELKQCQDMQLSQRNPSNYQTEQRSAFEITSENGYSIRMVRPSAR